MNCTESGPKTDAARHFVAALAAAWDGLPHHSAGAAPLMCARARGAADWAMLEPSPGGVASLKAPAQGALERCAALLRSLATGLGADAAAVVAGAGSPPPDGSAPGVSIYVQAAGEAAPAALYWPTDAAGRVLLGLPRQLDPPPPCPPLLPPEAAAAQPHGFAGAGPLTAPELVETLRRRGLRVHGDSASLLSSLPAETRWECAGEVWPEGRSLGAAVWVHRQTGRALYGSVDDGAVTFAAYDDVQSLRAQRPDYQRLLDTLAQLSAEARRAPGGAAAAPDAAPPVPRGFALKASRLPAAAGGADPLWDLAVLDGPDSPAARAAFGAVIQRALAEAGETRPTAYNADEFELEIVGGEGPINLGNCYGECRLAPPYRRPRLAELFATSMVAARGYRFAESAPEALTHLRPMIRARAAKMADELDAAGDASAGAASAGASYSMLTEQLVVEVVYDQPRAVFHLTEEQLARWGMTLAEAREVGLDNLRRSTPAIGRLFERTPSGLYLCQTGDGYDAARALLTPELRSLQLIGQAVVLPLHRDLLMVAGSGQEEAQAELAERAIAGLDHPRFNTAAPMRLTGSGYEPYAPPTNSPLHETYRQLRLRSAAREYAWQKAALRRRLERRGERGFVASFMIVQEPAGRGPASYTVWGAGITTLLPRADRVAFTDVRSRRGYALHYGSAPWARVAQAVGHLMQPVPGLYPERLRVSSFPTRAQFRAMRCTDLRGRPVGEPRLTEMGARQWEEARRRAEGQDEGAAPKS